MGFNWLDLPDEAMPFQPLIEIVGNKRVLIEHHCGITVYGSELICVKVKFGCVCVSGCSLELARMSKEQLIITGSIDSVRLERRS